MTTEPIARARSRGPATSEQRDTTSTRASLPHRLQFLAYRAGSACVRRLDHQRATAIGAAVGRLCWIVLRRRQRAALANTSRALGELTSEQRRRIARRSIENFGRFLSEHISAMRFSPSELEKRFEVIGVEHLTAARADGRGLILLTGHFGPFDLARYPLHPLVGSIHMVFRPLSNPLMDQEISGIRERAGTVLVPRKRAAQRLFLALRRGGVLAAAIDQRVNPLGGILVDFLGRPAWTASVPALLQLRTGAAVVPLFTYPCDDGRYRLEVDPPVSVDSLGDDPEVELTRRYLEPLERRIRRDPELWMWLHERWQLVFRHREPRFRERIARESGLDGLPPLETAAAAGFSVDGLGENAQRSLDWRFLESCRNVVLAGPRDAVDAAARKLVAAALEQGWAARAEHAPALAARLREAETRARLGAELRELDRRPLVWIEGLATVADGDARRLLALQLERRAGRGSMILEAGAARQRGDALDAAIARASADALRLSL